MPTPPTAAIYQGRPVTLEGFLRTCAKDLLPAFREGPWTMFKGSAGLSVAVEQLSYRNEAVDAAEAEVARLEALTEAQIVEAGLERTKIERQRAWGYHQSRVATYTRYQQMYAQVVAWQPPTPAHEAVKAFAIEQLSLDLVDEPEAPQHVEPTREGLLKEHADLLRVVRTELAQAREAKAQAIAYAREGTAWLKELHASLSEEGACTPTSRPAEGPVGEAGAGGSGMTGFEIPTPLASSSEVP